MLATLAAETRILTTFVPRSPYFLTALQVEGYFKGAYVGVTVVLVELVGSLLTINNLVRAVRIHAKESILAITEMIQEMCASQILHSPHLVDKRAIRAVIPLQGTSIQLTTHNVVGTHVSAKEQAG